MTVEGMLDRERETVEAVTELYDEITGEPVSLAQVAERLGLDKSAASRRVLVAKRHGYISDLETKRGRPSQLVPGDPMPEERPVLPHPDDLQGEGKGGSDPPNNTATLQRSKATDPACETGADLEEPRQPAGKRLIFVAVGNHKRQGDGRGDAEVQDYELGIEEQLRPGAFHHPGHGDVGPGIENALGPRRTRQSGRRLAFRARLVAEEPDEASDVDQGHESQGHLLQRVFGKV